ncbi:hypothetical protein ANN_28086 [Periplaneta americana]|uniref:Endonuclease/exonuclease/phosphatase domain-containing protein n=1 Tax=Periplaneta americana TaxID=6978 RepID=A0ABQ8RUW2_PERAM|nr:hypothetical protein ANN_28086 [Periplaneta americana]
MVGGGDLNSKHTVWGCRVGNSGGNKLYRHSLRSDYVVSAPRTPTHIPDNANHQPDTLDIALLKNINFHTKISVHDSLANSDHKPVIITFRAQLQLSPPKTVLLNKAADWELFRDKLDALTDDLVPTSSVEIEDAAKMLTNAIQESMSVIPTKTIIPEKLELSHESLKLIRERNYCRRAWQRTRDPRLRPGMNRLKREFSQKINDQIIQAWTQKVSNLDTDNMSEVWKITKFFTKPYSDIPSIQHNGTTYNSPEEKATIFAEVLENSFHPHGDLYDRHIHDKILQDTTTYLLNVDLKNNDAPRVRPASVHKIKWHVRQLPNKKAPGPDGIQAEVLKELSSKALKLLTNIINSIFRIGYFPNI